LADGDEAATALGSPSLRPPVATVISRHYGLLGPEGGYLIVAEAKAKAKLGWKLGARFGPLVEAKKLGRVDENEPRSFEGLSGSVPHPNKV